MVYFSISKIFPGTFTEIVLLRYCPAVAILKELFEMRRIIYSG